MDELAALRDVLGTPDNPSSAVTQHQRETLMAHVRSSGNTSDQADATRSSSVRLGRSRKRIVAMLVAPIVVVGLAAAGWTALRSGPATETWSFACVTDQDDGVTTILANDGSDPVAACAAIWKVGGMAVDVHEAPQLVACVRDTHVEVREGSTTDDCASYGLALWDEQPVWAETGAAVRSARQAAYDASRHGAPTCMSVADWETAVASQNAIAEWDLKVDSAPDRNCYDLAGANPSHETVHVVAVSATASFACSPEDGC